MRDYPCDMQDSIGFVLRIAIIITLAGYGFPAAHELVIRDKLEDNLLVDAAGGFVRVGSGGGRMDVVLEVEDFRTAKRRLVAELKNLASPRGRWSRGPIGLLTSEAGTIAN